MAKSNPNIPTVNITLQEPVSGHVVQGIVEGVPPTGATYANIFALDAILQDANGSGIYQMTGTTAVPAWTLIGSTLVSKTTTNLGTVQNSTPTAAQLLGGIVLQTSATGAGTVTLPTGTQLSAAVPGVAIGDSFQTSFTNLGGGQTLTLTSATGDLVVGTAAVPTGKGANILFTNVGTNSWNAYVTVSA